MTTLTGNSAANKAKELVWKAMQGGVVSQFFGFFMGRCTFFAICFSIAGVYGWLILGRDLTSFALFVTAVQGLLVLHSYKEDVAELKQVQNTTVVVNPASSNPPPGGNLQ